MIHMAKSFQVPFEPCMVNPWASGLAVTPNATPSPMPFLRFAEEIWLKDPRGGLDKDNNGSLVSQRRWFNVIAKFQAAKPGYWITLDDEDFAVLKKIVESPKRSFQDLEVTMACIPYSDAVLAAVDAKPADDAE
jgi:hypothetical protein